MSPRILSAGIIPIFWSAGNWHFLLLRCYKNWDFPKGEIDGAEDPLKAACRELREETDLSQCKILLDGAFIETEPYAKNKVARYFLGIVDNKAVKLLPNPENGVIEHHEYQWLSYSEARNLLNPRLQKVIDWAHQNLENK